MQSVLRYSFVWTVEKCTSLKIATHRMKRRRTAETCKFQRSIHKRIFLTLRTYTAWSMRGAFTEQTLRSTGYKYLEIGINAGPSSYVEIALGDHHGRELSLSLETWKGFYEQRWNIYKVLRNEYNFISVGLLTVSVCTLNDAALVRLDSSFLRWSKRHYDV